jgi:N-acetylmuramoyl-L-alanine amidase
VTPSGGNYINVGSGYIAEVIQVNVETFDGDTYDDFSHPTNNYLPKGTVDYCAKELTYGSSMKYVVLRSGHRVYYDKKVYPFGDGYYKMIEEVKQYAGTLPDHNEIGVASLEIVGHHSILTLDTLWKAPFYFDLLPQRYANPDNKDYAVTACTATYVDITFCYATKFEGKVQIPQDNPLFSHAELTQNEDDCTLRLYLKKTGAFFGWDAYYNDNDQLCFSFLNPAKATAADNVYGASLTGITIMLDVGHGGYDGGAEAIALTGSTNRTKSWSFSLY